MRVLVGVVTLMLVGCGGGLPVSDTFAPVEESVRSRCMACHTGVTPGTEALIFVGDNARDQEMLVQYMRAYGKSTLRYYVDRNHGGLTSQESGSWDDWLDDVPDDSPRNPGGPR